MPNEPVTRSIPLAVISKNLIRPLSRASQPLPFGTLDRLLLQIAASLPQLFALPVLWLVVWAAAPRAAEVAHFVVTLHPSHQARGIAARIPTALHSSNPPSRVARGPRTGLVLAFSLEAGPGPHRTSGQEAYTTTHRSVGACAIFDWATPDSTSRAA